MGSELVPPALPSDPSSAKPYNYDTLWVDFFKLLFGTEH